jgi:hypothetical protein
MGSRMVRQALEGEEGGGFAGQHQRIDGVLLPGLPGDTTCMRPDTNLGIMCCLLRRSSTMAHQARPCCSGALLCKINPCTTSSALTVMQSSVRALFPGEAPRPLVLPTPASSVSGLTCC